MIQKLKNGADKDDDHVRICLWKLGRNLFCGGIDSVKEDLWPSTDATKSGRFSLSSVASRFAKAAHTKSRTKALTVSELENELDAGVSPFKAKEALLFSAAAKTYLQGKEYIGSAEDPSGVEGYSVAIQLRLWAGASDVDISATLSHATKPSVSRMAFRPAPINIRVGSCGPS